MRGDPQNASATNLRGALVRRAAVATFVKRPVDAVDLVFVDPPYAGTEDEVDAVLAALPGWLQPGRPRRRRTRLTDPDARLAGGADARGAAGLRRDDAAPGVGMTDLASAVEGWAPGPVTTTGTTTPWTVAAVSGMFDLDPVAGEGDPLPPMWHWFGFLDHPRQDQLGDDGHLDAGHFLPPMRERRRMMAGGRLRFRAPMRVGETLTRRSSLVGAQVKHGRSGEMLLVTVRDEYVRGNEVLASPRRPTSSTARRPPARRAGSGSTHRRPRRRRPPARRWS